MLCFHQCQRGRLLDTIVQMCVVFDVTQMSYQLSVSAYRAHLVRKIVFCVYQAFLKVSTELTRVSKELMEKNSINRAPMVNEGNLERVTLN